MIAIASDHGGYDMKEAVKKYLTKNGWAYKDFGCNDKNSCDYPDFAGPAAASVASGECEKGIVICTTGIGVSMVANKTKGIRCGLCSDVTSAKLTRLHNNANVLALGAGLIGENVAIDVVEAFLNTPFSEEEKHSRRIGKVMEIEK